MNKQVKGGLFGKVIIETACNTDKKLDEKAEYYVDIINKRNNSFSGLAHGGIDDPKKALKAVMPHKDKNEHPEYKSYYADKNLLPDCSEERKKIFNMLALKKAAIKKGKDNNRNYGPYFDMLFKKVDESKKQEAKNKLINVFGFTIKDKEPEEVTEEPEVEYKESKKVTEEPEVTDVNKDDYMFTDVEGERSLTSVGGSRKYKKNLCHKKSVKKPNKCKKVKGCKPASGPKRTFCRKIKNKNNKTQKKNTPFRFNLGERLQDLTKKAAKELRKLQ